MSQQLQRMIDDCNLKLINGTVTEEKLEKLAFMLEKVYEENNPPPRRVAPKQIVREFVWEIVPGDLIHCIQPVDTIRKVKPFIW